MDLRPVSSPPPTSVAPSAETKRAQLQALILRKSLEAQRAQVADAARRTEGKGRLLDIEA